MGSAPCAVPCPRAQLSKLVMDYDQNQHAVAPPGGPSKEGLKRCPVLLLKNDTSHFENPTFRCRRLSVLNVCQHLVEALSEVSGGGVLNLKTFSFVFQF